MQIRTLTIKADLDVIGIVNMNGHSQTASKKNHTFSKRDALGRDFTSSRILRRTIFSDLMPRQPATREMYDNAVPIAASMVGILRGLMFPEKGCRRTSPLCVLDAYTREEYMRPRRTSDGLDTRAYRATFVDIGRSSKPQEGNLTNKKGEKVSDTSFWSKDNAGRRIQDFEAKIDFSALTFISLNFGDDAIITREDEGRYLDLMNQLFSSLGEDGKVVPQRLVHKTAVVKSRQYGILLNDLHVRKILGYILDRIQRLEIAKSGSSLRLLPETLRLTISDGNQSKTLDFGSFCALIDTMQFYRAYEPNRE